MESERLQNIEAALCRHLKMIKKTRLKMLPWIKKFQYLPVPTLPALPADDLADNHSEYVIS